MVHLSNTRLSTAEFSKMSRFKMYHFVLITLLHILAVIWVIYRSFFLRINLYSVIVFSFMSIRKLVIVV